MRPFKGAEDNRPLPILLIQHSFSETACVFQILFSFLHLFNVKFLHNMLVLYAKCLENSLKVLLNLVALIWGKY